MFNDAYIPLILQRKKWHFAHENLLLRDIVYFKLTEYKMSQDWRIGKVEGVKTGTDGYVCEIIILQKHFK